jgi:AmiR/NasT family two-component response regulator
MEQLTEEITQLKESLATRATIGQATGIVGGRLQVTTETAWRLLRRASQDCNVKVRRVAEIIVAAHDGSLPPDDDAIAERLSPILGIKLT